MVNDIANAVKVVKRQCLVTIRRTLQHGADLIVADLIVAECIVQAGS
jgi:hypothetical protein